MQTNEDSRLEASSGVMKATRLRDVPLGQSYSTGVCDLISDFYVPCLSAAMRYDRAVGYFRSSLFAVVGVAMSDFALRGGRFRLVCSPYLERSDAKAIEDGLEMREAIDRRLDWEIDQILTNPKNRPVVVLLATLIAAGAMDVRLAYRPKHFGIFHPKIGVFYDNVDTVSFVGSSNETFSAWDTHGNHEAFEVFCSWNTDIDRVQSHVDYYDRLWHDRVQGVRVCDFPEASKSRLLQIAESQSVESSIQAVREEYRLLSRNGVGRAVVSPPRRRVLLPHQVAAVENWITNDNRGIVGHATGAGKTLTALEAVRRWTSTERPALIVVPSQILAEQWRDEAVTELGFSTAFLDAGAGFGRDVWEHELADQTRNLAELGPRVVIATMQTASTHAFLQRVQAGEHLLLVADEVHRIGSSQHRRILGIEAGGRLGLSATPERFGDPEGTGLILEYFGPLLDPPFGLGDAIEAGRLVPYDYYVHQVPLTADEQALWDEATERIRRQYARLGDGPEGKKLLTEPFKLLLIQRARIAKQASRKVDLARDIVTSEYREDDRWLVYCDAQTQLREVVDTLRETGIDTYEYHSAMHGSRSATLRYFEGHAGVLVSIRCLDEGVDIPLVNRALILSSSTNPREFIQRRGRVLRTAPGKHSATIHDALVVPCAEFGADDPQSAILRTELRRALQFAQNARNDSVRHSLEIIARRAGLEPLAGVEFDFEDPDEEG